MIGFICFLAWWAVGITACAWSFEWDIKGVKLVVLGIGLTGPLCIFEAIAIRRKTLTQGRR